MIASITKAIKFKDSFKSMQIETWMNTKNSRIFLPSPVEVVFKSWLLH